VEDPEVMAGVEAVMAQKYGNVDRLAGAVFEHGAPVAVRLDPVPDTRGPQG
jgi:hypothetical protein